MTCLGRRMLPLGKPFCAMEVRAEPPLSALSPIQMAFLPLHGLPRSSRFIRVPCKQVLDLGFDGYLGRRVSRVMAGAAPRRMGGPVVPRPGFT